MRRMLLASACLALGLVASIPAPSRAEDDAGAPEGALWQQSRSPMPFDIIRSLQFLQDQVARGNDRAIRVQALLLNRFAPVFLQSDAESWQDPRNRRAAILFVLSGGPTQVLEGLLREGVLPETDHDLFQGALAYSRNDLPRARTLLSAIDRTEMEPGLAGHLELVLGQLWQSEDAARAALHLDRARLLAPGGLIEEAALRLEVLMVEELGDHERANRLARQYFDRYAASSYAGNFEARFVAAFAARGEGDAQAAMAAMEDVLTGLPMERKALLFLSVARRSLVQGRLPFAELAAARALDIGALAEADLQRARLYRLASALSKQTPAEAERELAAIDRAKLHPEDVLLLDAAVKVATAIEDGVPPQTQRVARAETEAADAGEPEPLSPVLARADRLLNEVSTVLGKSSNP